MENIEIKTKNSGLITLTVFKEDERGTLAFGESGSHIPFDIKRIYYLTDLERVQTERGGHAHKETDQVIYCLRGSFTLNLDDGETQQEILMNNPALGVRLGPGLWHTMKNFSPDCLILVVASKEYDASDYLRDYEAFLAHIRN